MIFEALYNSAINHELILVNNGLCRYHIRRDGQITIREILVLPEYQNNGIGTEMLNRIRNHDAHSVFAKCPIDLPSNTWYKRMGFQSEGVEETGSGRKIEKWRLYIQAVAQKGFMK